MLSKDEYLKTVRRPYPPLFCSLVCFNYAKKEYYRGILKKPFSILDMAHVDNIWYYSKAEIDEGGKLALESWEDKKVFEYVKKEFKKRADNLVNSAKKDFKSFTKAYGEYMPALALIFAVEKFIEKALREALSSKLSEEEVDDLMSELNIPLENNFYKQEEYDLVNSKDLDKHVRDYEWIHARYGEETKYTIEDAKKRLKEINKKGFLKKWKEDKEKLKKVIANTKKILRKKAYLVDLFQYIIYYRTQRTDIMNKAGYLAIPMLKKTAESLGLTYEELLVCSFLEVLEKDIPSKEILKQRIKDCSILLENGELRCLTGKDSEKIIDFFKEEISNVNELKGSVACKGIVKGKVKVIINRKDFDKMNNGDVLVASMTTPEMVPVMKKAAGFVTDEGGVTCHAAIISREMKKPCVIGTKIATKVLHDGDLVEVDADNGIVRILK